VLLSALPWVLVFGMPIDLDSVTAVVGDVVAAVGNVSAPVDAIKALFAVAKFVDRSPAIERSLKESRDASVEATAVAAHAASIGLAAVLTKVTPTQEVVERLVEAAHSGPGAPFRVWRLLGETAKSASYERRVFLASFFYALPFTTAREDERNRIDMLVERLMPEDVSLLKRIADLVAQVPDPHHAGHFISNYPIKAETPKGVLIVSSQHRNEGFLADPVALTSLIMHGCVSDSDGFWGETVAAGGADASGTMLAVTPLGQLLARAFEDVRPVVEAALSFGAAQGYQR
jgi:hypothetical protein